MKDNHGWPYDITDDDYPEGWLEHERDLREQRRARRIAVLWIVSAWAFVVAGSGYLGWIAHGAWGS